MVEDREEQKRVIETKKRRLQKLRLQAAQFGASVDPGVSIEIEDLETEIAGLEGALNPRPTKALAKMSSAPKVTKGQGGKFDYVASSLADVDFPMPHGHKLTEIVSKLRSGTWRLQSPAIEALLKLKWPEVSADEAFVLGRNLYQVACGGEFKAVAVIDDLRRELARIPDEWAVHIVNGMFYEIYFNHKNEFRGAQDLKDKYIDKLFELETVGKYADCVEFIRSSLDRYRGQLGVLPSSDPEKLVAYVRVCLGDPAVITSITCEGTEQLISRTEDDEDDYDDCGYDNSPSNFRLSGFEEELRKIWGLPKGHFEVEFDKELQPASKLKIADTKLLGLLTLKR